MFVEINPLMHTDVTSTCLSCYISNALTCIQDDLIVLVIWPRDSDTPSTYV